MSIIQPAPARGQSLARPNRPSYDWLQRMRDRAETDLQRHESAPCKATTGTEEYAAWWDKERRLLMALRAAQRALDAFETPDFDASLPLFPAQDTEGDGG